MSEELTVGDIYPQERVAGAKLVLTTKENTKTRSISFVLGGVLYVGVLCREAEIDDWGPVLIVSKFQTDKLIKALSMSEKFGRRLFSERAEIAHSALEDMYAGTLEGGDLEEAFATVSDYIKATDHIVDATAMIKAAQKERE